MKKILILVKDYPNNLGIRKLYYVHVRNLEYSNINHFEITVLNFSTIDDYFIDGIRVISLETYQKSNEAFDICLSHASNLKNHLLFLRKYNKRFQKIIFFFHGHEILRVNKYYPQQYSFVQKRYTQRFVQNLYDNIKIAVWKLFFNKYKYKINFVFVSNWIKQTFEKETNFDLDHDFFSYSIIYNSVGEYFQKNSYNPNIEKKYDFITIRNNYDGSSYSIDLIRNLAINNPKRKFLVIGNGKFFEYYKAPSNLKLIQSDMSHLELGSLINQSKFALMPTKQDTQGIMSCELATFGIPLITSKIKVCEEIFEGFKNVFLVENNFDDYNKFINSQFFNNHYYKKNEKYFTENTTLLEVKLIDEV